MAGVPFALNPAQATVGVIDFTRESNVKLHKRATSRLSEDLFDCVPEDLNHFLKLLGDRSSEFSWNDPIVGIMMIPENPADYDTTYTNLLTNHGQISLQRIRTFEESYINTPTRAAQDTDMLYHCLMSSLSKVGRTKVMIWEKQYKINDRASGNLLLKVIIRESHLDGNATTTVIRTKLSSLDTFINTIGCDITKFNAHIQLLLEGLSARGETTNNLLINLFKGYKAATDNTFVKYIERKQEEYDDGNSMTSNQLMELADKKYKNLKLNGLWNAPSEQEEKILALSAEVEKLKRDKSRKQKKTDDDKTNEPKNKTVKPNWLLRNEKPTPDRLMESRTWDERKWYWCGPENGGKCDGRWQCHKPSECQGKGFKVKKKNERKQDESNKRLKLSKAMQAVIDNAKIESESESGEE